MCLKLFKKKNNFVDIYTISSVDDPNTYITYTSTVEEAQEYFGKWAKIHWADSFKVWCNWSEGESIDSEESWLKYIQQEYTVEQFSKYIIFKLSMPANAVASLMRMQDLCLPLDVLFIMKKQKDYYRKVTADMRSVVIDNLKRQIAAINFKDVLVTGDVDGKQ